MKLRRQSKKRRAVDVVGTYLKFKAISKFAKAARKGIAGAPKAVKALPLVAGVGAAGAVAARRRRESGPKTA